MEWIDFTSGVAAAALLLISWDLHRIKQRMDEREQRGGEGNVAPGAKGWLDARPLLSGLLFGLVFFGLATLAKHLVTGPGAF